jgi:hypothetical protein
MTPHVAVIAKISAAGGPRIALNQSDRTVRQRSRHLVFRSRVQDTAWSPSFCRHRAGDRQRMPIATTMRGRFFGRETSDLRPGRLLTRKRPALEHVPVSTYSGCISFSHSRPPSSGRQKTHDGGRLLPVALSQPQARSHCAGSIGTKDWASDGLDDDTRSPCLPPNESANFGSTGFALNCLNHGD